MWTLIYRHCDSYEPMIFNYRSFEKLKESLIKSLESEIEDHEEELALIEKEDSADTYEDGYYADWMKYVSQYHILLDKAKNLNENDGDFCFTIYNKNGYDIIFNVEIFPLKFED